MSNTNNTPQISAPITFSLDNQSKNFQLGSYSAAQTNGRLSPAQINHCLSIINAQLGLYFFSPSFQSKCLFIILYIILLCLLTLIRWSLSNLVGNITNLEICIMLIAYTFLMLSGRSCIMIHLQSQAKAKCQQVIDKHNEILKSRGLRWSLPKEFPNWIELHKDYQNPKANHNQSQEAPDSQEPSVSQSQEIKLNVKPESKPQQNFLGRSNNEKYAPLSDDNEADLSTC